MTSGITLANFQWSGKVEVGMEQYKIIFKGTLTALAVFFFVFFYRHMMINNQVVPGGFIYT